MQDTKPLIVITGASRGIGAALAQIYADYISEQGGSFLRTDFASEVDPLEFTRRMLGLDGIDPDSGRTRVKLANGKRFHLSNVEMMN